jgi:GntR family transcriptional regulator, carbon starvation induced regulator
VTYVECNQLTDLPMINSLTRAAYERLRADVLSCRLRPGAKLVISDLCKSMGFSLGAVREALARLVAEDLVVPGPRRGFEVAPISEDELRDIAEARATIECICLDRAIRQGSVEWECNVVAAHHELTRTPQTSERWEQAHARFHTALVQACDNKWLLRLNSILYVQSERYRHLIVSLNLYSTQFSREHKAMLDAALARDATRAVGVLRSHIHRQVEVLMDAGVVAPRAGSARASRRSLSASPKEGHRARERIVKGK